MNTCGDANFSEDFRNPGNMQGSHPNGAPDAPVADLFYQIAMQRERILEAFLAEHSNIKPSQVAQIVTPLPNGSVAWHLEIKEDGR